MNHLDDRLRAAFHDLDRRVAQSLEPSAERGFRRPPVSWFPVFAGAAAVIAVLVLVGWMLHPTAATTPAVPSVTANEATPPPGPGPVSPSPAVRSQSPGDALRDGVSPALAAMPLIARLQPIEPLNARDSVTVYTDEGVWLISRPDLGADCLPHNPGAYQACPDYTEILLMSADLKTIVQAFPVPDLPVQWLTLTDDAVYFGRQGDGAIPDSMLGRIDRHDRSLTARVFPYQVPDQVTPRTFQGWPGHWSNARRGTENRYNGVRLEGGRLGVLDRFGTQWSTVDPVTLR